MWMNLKMLEQPKSKANKRGLIFPIVLEDYCWFMIYLLYRFKEHDYFGFIS